MARTSSPGQSGRQTRGIGRSLLPPRVRGPDPTDLRAELARPTPLPALGGPPVVAPLAVEVGAVAEATVAVFGILTTCWAVMKWVNRPRFICGVPPSAAEQSSKGIRPAAVGRVSVSHGYRHRRQCFACRLWRRHKRGLTRWDLWRTARPLRCRTLSVAADGSVTFPVLVANAGHRIALDYTVSVSTYEPDAADGLHVVDVLTESLEFRPSTAGGAP